MISEKIRQAILRGFFEPVDAHTVALCARIAGETSITAQKVQELWAEEFNQHPFMQEFGARPRFGYPESDRCVFARRCYA